MSPALKHIKHVWDHARGGSYQILNQSLRAALSLAISSGMKFEKSDFSYIAKELSFGRWSGENLEWAYSLACGEERGTGSPSAVQALEHYLKRDPFIWAEKTKTAERLYVGSEFTWQGCRVKLTSFNDAKKSIIACQYNSPRHDREDETAVGYKDYCFRNYRRIEAFQKYEDGSIVVRYSAPVEDDDSKPIRRFTISIDDMKAARKAYDERRRRHEKAIREATTLDALTAASEAANAEGRESYRHFDIEILQELIRQRNEQIRESISRAEAAKWEEKESARAAENLERWVAGENVDGYLRSPSVRIRVKGDYVETSNGHKVSVEAARKTLAFVQRHKSGWHRNGQSFNVDAFELREISSRGVQIGCTLIPWSEVDRCRDLLAKQPEAVGV